MCGISQHSMNIIRNSYIIVGQLYVYKFISNVSACAFNVSVILKTNKFRLCG